MTVGSAPGPANVTFRRRQFYPVFAPRSRCHGPRPWEFSTRTPQQASQQFAVRAAPLAPGLAPRGPAPLLLSRPAGRGQPFGSARPDLCTELFENTRGAAHLLLGLR